MLIKKYYDKFAEIFGKHLATELNLLKKNCIKEYCYFNRRKIINGILQDFMVFMKEDNSLFDCDKFKKMCGLED